VARCLRGRCACTRATLAPCAPSCWKSLTGSSRIVSGKGRTSGTRSGKESSTWSPPKRFGAERELIGTYEPGLFDPVQGLANYRVPDLALVHPDRVSKRGIEGGAALLVEILSPDDESRDKLPFYARIGVSEVWLLEPNTRTIEVLSLQHQELVTQVAIAGRVRSPLLGIELATVPGPRLAIYD